MSTTVAIIQIDDSSDKSITGKWQFDKENGGALVVPFVTGALPATASLEREVVLFGTTLYTWVSSQWVPTTTYVTGAADPDAQYLVLSATGSLANEREFTVGTGLNENDGGAGAAYTISIDNSVVATLSGSTFSGPLIASGGLSGSLQRLESGETFLAAGSNILITTGANGQVTIAFSGTLVLDHGSLTGRDDDDHLQYYHISGTRALAGDMDAGGFNITNVATASVVFLSGTNAEFGETVSAQLFNGSVTGSHTEVSAGVPLVIGTGIIGVGLNAQEQFVVSASNVQREPTGMYPSGYNHASTISRVDGTRTFTIAPSGSSSYDFWVQGTQFVKTASLDINWSDTEGNHFFYFDVSGTLSYTTDEEFLEQVILGEGAFVSYIYWDATNNVSTMFEERHGLHMDGATHLYLHRTRGAQFIAGGALGDIIADASGDLDTHAQLSVTDVTIVDEDIELKSTDTTQVITTAPAQIDIYYMLGASADWRKKPRDNFSFIWADSVTWTDAQGRPAYNQFTGGAWQLSVVPDNSYFLVHYFAVGAVDGRIIGICGQNVYGNITQARAGAETELGNLLGVIRLFSLESVPLATVIYHGDTSFLNQPQTRIVTTGDGADYIDWRFTDSLPGGVAQEHANLGGLTVGDDHTQYALLAGRAGGQTLIGGSAAGENLVLQSTSNATRGNVVVQDNEFRVRDNAVTSKQLAFELSGIASGTTRTITMPDSDVDLGDVALNNAHRVDLDNPHSTSIGNIVSGTLAELNAALTDATLGSLTNTAPVNVTKASALVGTGSTAARQDHKHDVSTAAAVAATVGQSNAEGSATTLARSDHTHQHSAGTPVNVTKASNSAGVATTFARSDHKHDITTAAAGSIGATNAEGTATSLARSDHTHAVTDLALSGSAQGAIAFRGASVWEVLEPGTSGSLLATLGAGANPIWTPPSSGDVVGPGSSVDNTIVRWNGTSGNLIQTSSIVIDDNGNLLLTTNGSTTAAPRIMGFQNFSTSEAYRLQMTVNEGWQSEYGGAATLYCYNTLVLRGDRNTVGAPAFDADLGIGVAVIGTTPGDPVLVVSGAASQTAALQQWKNSAGSVLAQVQADGDFELNNHDVQEVKVATYNSVISHGSMGATETIDWSAGARHSATNSATVTISFTAPPGPCNLMLVLTNGGAYTITWPGTVLWPGGTEPTWTTSGVDVIAFFYDGTNYYGVGSLDFS